MSILDRFKKEKESALAETASAASAHVQPEQSGVRQPGAAYRILVKPLVSEKSAVEEAHGRYCFVVALSASKTDIKRAVHAVYGIMPVRVRTSIIDGKRMRFGSRLGRRSEWKKAVVHLPKGKTITVHKGV